MEESNLLETLGQVSAEEAGEIYREHLRGGVRIMIAEIMAEEVDYLCGPKHRPAGVEFYRAGSSPGRVILDGRREDIVRPRVRAEESGGTTREVVLVSYSCAIDADELKGSIVTALAAGVSTRGVEQVKPDSPGVGKSNVSRLWKSAGIRYVEKLRSRDLSKEDWAVLMLDGIRLSKEQLAVAAVGITAGGEKNVLDFELGSSENAEVAKGLMRRLMKRGFHCDRPLYAVLDGSDALRSAVKEFFPDSVIQRCLVHKERNIRSKLSKKHWGELARLFKRLREVQGEEEAKEVVEELEEFLEPINAEALKSLHEAGEDLTALQSLDVPNTLHKNLLSTNAIENSFLNTRRRLGRVTRFRAETDQASRWLAYALMEAEKGFQRISGYRDLPHLTNALEEKKRKDAENMKAESAA